MITKQEAYSPTKLYEDLVKYINRRLEGYEGTSVVIHDGELEAFILSHIEDQMELVVQSYKVLGWEINFKNEAWYFT